MIQEKIQEIKTVIEEGKHLPPEKWLDYAFELNFLLLEESEKLNKIRQEIAIERHRIYKGQRKKSATATNIEIETTDRYVEAQNLESFIRRADETIRIAKKHADTKL